MKTIVVKFVILSMWILGGCYIMVGCQQEDDLKVECTLTYLSVEGDLGDLNKMSKRELEIFFEALGRINIEEENGLYQLREKSGVEINISENLYRFFVEKIEKENQKLISSPLAYSRPRTRAGVENGYDSEPTDCMAHTIADVLGYYGANTSFGNVSSWIEDEYGKDGVPGGDYYDVMDHYFVGERMAIPNYYDKYEFYKDPSVVVAGVIGRPEGGTAHSISIRCIENNNVYYYDNQVGEDYICTVMDLRYLYKIKGVK